MVQAERWRSHRVLGTLLSSAAVAAPFAVSIVAAMAVGREIPRGEALFRQALWWVAVLGSSAVAFVGSERLCRRLLPLAALLKMTMLFPDQAPKRMKVAWRAGTTRELERGASEGPSTNQKVPAAVAEEILALATSLGRHDRKTRGHSERVRAFTDMIADEMRLPLADRDRLRWSALLHDVGKLSVHPDVLNKAEKLTDAEWQEIRDHPLEGRRLVAPLAPWLGAWSLAIEQHHENHDGSGYPFGLSGDEISLGARIVSVADAFEVMTAVRSYKKAMSPVAARTELTRCAGSQFDPAIVRAFLNVSIGRLRWVIGPVSWVADVPFVARLGMAGHALATGAQVAVGAAALTAGGVLAAHAAAPAPQANIVRATPIAASVTTTGTTTGTTMTVPPPGFAGPARTVATTVTTVPTTRRATTTTNPSTATTRRPKVTALAGQTTSTVTAPGVGTTTGTPGLAGTPSTQAPTTTAGTPSPQLQTAPTVRPSTVPPTSQATSTTARPPTPTGTTAARTDEHNRRTTRQHDRGAPSDRNCSARRRRDDFGPGGRFHAEHSNSRGAGDHDHEAAAHYDDPGGNDDDTEGHYNQADHYHSGRPLRLGPRRPPLFSRRRPPDRPRRPPDRPRRPPDRPRRPPDRPRRPPDRPRRRLATTTHHCSADDDQRAAHHHHSAHDNDGCSADDDSAACHNNDQAPVTTTTAPATTTTTHCILNLLGICI